MITKRMRPIVNILTLAMVLFLAACATANKNYHGITLGDDVAFEFGKASLTPTGKAMLDEYVESIKKRDNIRIDIVGHSDRIGKDSVNRELALRRAQAARAQMISAGMDPDIVFVRSVGPDEPLVECQDTNRQALIKCLAPNRRVEVFLNSVQR